MTLTGTADIERLLAVDADAMTTLRAAASLGLRDWWIGAGFVRNRVWDALTGAAPRGERDVDLAYFDPADASGARDAALEARAGRLLAAPWEIRNQARMHERNGDAPYMSTLDAIGQWPETATCIAATLDAGRVRVVACHGLADLLTLTVRPSPRFDTADGRAAVRDRAARKGWQARWPGLRVEA